MPHKVKWRMAQPSAQQLIHLDGLLPHLLYKPQDLPEPAPLILFLHGRGERGADLGLLKRHGLPKRLTAQPLPCLVLSPQCPGDSWWPYELDALDALLDDALVRYEVDERRVYLTGLSMGGYGAWHWAVRRPESFAALAPVCGGGDPARACALKSMPVWAFHGAEDMVVPLEKSEEMVAAVNACGGNARLTVYPGVGHDSWTRTFENPELYDWLFEQKLEDQGT